MSEGLAIVEEKLLEVEPEVTEYEFKISGASGFEGAENLHIGETVSVSLGAIVAGVAVVQKERKSKDDDGEMEEYLVRVVTLKATGARIR